MLFISWRGSPSRWQRWVLAKTSDLEQWWVPSDGWICQQKCGYVSFPKRGLCVYIYIYKYIYIYMYIYIYHVYPEFSSSHVCQSVTCRFWKSCPTFSHSSGSLSCSMPFPSKRDNRKDVAKFPRGSFPDWLMMGDIYSIYSIYIHTYVYFMYDNINLYRDHDVSLPINAFCTKSHPHDWFLLISP